MVVVAIVDENNAYATSVQGPVCMVSSHWVCFLCTCTWYVCTHVRPFPYFGYANVLTKRNRDRNAVVGGYQVLGVGACCNDQFKYITRAATLSMTTLVLRLHVLFGQYYNSWDRSLHGGARISIMYQD